MKNIFASSKVIDPSSGNYGRIVKRFFLIFNLCALSLGEFLFSI